MTFGGDFLGAAAGGFGLLTALLAESVAALVSLGTAGAVDGLEYGRTGLMLQLCQRLQYYGCYLTYHQRPLLSLGLVFALKLACWWLDCLF